MTDRSSKATLLVFHYIDAEQNEQKMIKTYTQTFMRKKYSELHIVLTKKQLSMHQQRQKNALFSFIHKLV